LEEAYNIAMGSICIEKVRIIAMGTACIEAACTGID
jgi:hypothetical protein